MIGTKKLAGMLTIAALLAACGGGGGGDDGGTLPTAGTGAPSSGGSPTTGGSTTTPPGDTNQNPGNQPPDNTGGEQVNDTRLAGNLSIVANQLVFLKADRSIYNAIQLETFETGDGLLDAAAGSTGTETPPAPPATWVTPSATAPVAPIAALGLRIDRFVQATTEEPSVGGQTAVGRLALKLVERADSREIAAGQVAEQLSFVLDGVELSTADTGELTGVRVRDGAQIHVYGVTANGNEIRESLPASAQSVRLLPVSEVLDNYGDTSSTVLLLDLEHAFAQAGTRLAGLESISGHFDMDLTLSAAKIVRPAEGALERRELTGKSITVNTQPAVTGTGISGTAWIRSYP